MQLHGTSTRLLFIIAHIAWESGLGYGMRNYDVLSLMACHLTSFLYSLLYPMSVHVLQLHDSFCVLSQSDWLYAAESWLLDFADLFALPFIFFFTLQPLFIVIKSFLWLLILCPLAFLVKHWKCLSLILQEWPGVDNLVPPNLRTCFFAMAW